MKSSLQHQFSQIPDVKIQRSSFNRSHCLKTTFDAGYLIPIYVDECLPGDSFNLKITTFARLATPLKPIMDNIHMEVFFFAVPNRLVWEHWKNFCGERAQTDIDLDPVYTIPQIESDDTNGWATGSLGDYFGIPIDSPSLKCSALPFRAYNLIYNEWFRDQNLIDPVTVDIGDADSDPADYVLLKRGKRHDYFTSCLPWPQKGESVTLPIGDEAPVIGNGGHVWVKGSVELTDREVVIKNKNAPTISGVLLTPQFNSTADENMEWSSQANHSGLIADLSSATASTINELRQAFQIQRMLERDARGGSRLIEIIRSHFGVVSPDARLQRPEFLGSAKVRLNINPVTQTSSTTSTKNLGDMAGYGVASLQGGFVKSFTEHCTIIGVACAFADLTYQQGLDRMWSRKTRYDFYWPSLANLGEQAVLNKEIYFDNVTPENNEGVFGFQERYAEYRYAQSKITGLYRSGAYNSLHIWHLAQQFGEMPELGQDFIEENPPIDRVIAVPTQPHILYDSYIELNCVRPMPVYSVPGMIDHF